MFKEIVQVVKLLSLPEAGQKADAGTAASCPLRILRYWVMKEEKLPYNRGLDIISCGEDNLIESFVGASGLADWNEARGKRKH